jgi:SAM-dependent methyltransferase
MEWIAKGAPSQPIENLFIPRDGGLFTVSRGSQGCQPHKEPTCFSRIGSTAFGKGLYLRNEAHQWDEQADHYDYPRIRDPIYMAGIEAAVRALAPQAGDHILDAGCGTGLTIARYADSTVRIVAADISIESLKQVLRRVRSPTVVCLQADLTTLPFATDVFDKVLCANAIQHLPTRELRQQAVRELCRVVRPDGKVVITVHNYSGPKRRAGWNKEGPANGGSVQYIYRHDKHEFSELLAESLQIEGVRGAGLPLPYRWKLSPMSRYLERILSQFTLSADWGHMLVGVGRKLPASANVKEDRAIPSWTDDDMR